MGDYADSEIDLGFAEWGSYGNEPTPRVHGPKCRICGRPNAVWDGLCNICTVKHGTKAAKGKDGG